MPRHISAAVGVILSDAVAALAKDSTVQARNLVCTGHDAMAASACFQCVQSRKSMQQMTAVQKT